MYTCRRCGFAQQELWEGLCPNPRCSGLYRAKRVGGASADSPGRSTFAAASKPVWTYVPTGVEGFDKVLGGGLVAGCSILFGGFRGAGKSTLLSLVCAAVAERKGSALYASSEEGVDGVLSIAHRLELLTENVHVLGNQRDVAKVFAYIKQMEKPPFITIYDSAQKFASDNAGGSPGSGAQLTAVSDAIHEFHQDNKTCAVIVNQMTKEGDLKGSTDAAHAVEVVLVLAFPKDDDEDVPDIEGVRVLLCDDKNRRGPENIKSYWRMTDEGKLEHLPPKSKLIKFRKR